MKWKFPHKFDNVQFYLYPGHTHSVVYFWSWDICHSFRLILILMLQYTIKFKTLMCVNTQTYLQTLLTIIKNYSDRSLN